MFYYGMCVSLTLYHDLVIYDYVMLCNAWQPVYNPVITHSRPLSGSRPTVWELLLCAVCQVFLSGDLGLLLMLVAMVTDSIRSGLWVVKCDECGKKSYVVLNDLTLMNVITSQPFFFLQGCSFTQGIWTLVCSWGKLEGTVLINEWISLCHHTAVQNTYVMNLWDKSTKQKNRSRTLEFILLDSGLVKTKGY